MQSRLTGYVRPSGRRELMSVEVFSSSHQHSSQRRLTHMLLFVSFAWLVLSAPFALHSLLANFIGYDRLSADRNLFVKAVCFLLVYVNHAMIDAASIRGQVPS